MSWPVRLKATCSCANSGLQVLFMSFCPAVDMRAVGVAQQLKRVHTLVPTLRQHAAATHGLWVAAAAAATHGAAAAAAVATQAAGEQQQHVPHVSVLLQEVLHNLNHMPIKVRWAEQQHAGVRWTCVGSWVPRTSRVQLLLLTSATGTAGSGGSA
jgi:hypothetical protein